ncbi:metallophosphoesterase [Pontibaca salina]|uniref:Serine/threonine protein phosphatase n=1 Tax=Pontibaca salina TaxID=2795731 RepID=A0A934LZB3_9RHOB|nr:metallophosphoesterase [Pontibaca salina]MBI6630717.1 serine/threonine protein phosphatase [Pontibaca salina]
MSGAPIYVIGDIHGHADKLDHALDLIARDGGAEAEIVFLGDLVDRGPDSCGVIDRLVQGQAEGRDWHVLRGNHDDLFARYLRNGAVHDDNVASGLGWLHSRIGGRPTLASYGVEYAGGGSAAELLPVARAAVPSAHRAFLDELPLYHQRGALLFVHAGIRPEVPLAEQSRDDLLWIRDPFLNHVAPHSWLVVHGHTALDAPRHYSNRLNMDGGAGYGRALVPAVIEGRDVWALTVAGRMALKP